MDIGLLLLRLAVGLTLAAHGTQKLLEWSGGPGLGAKGQSFTVLGFPPGRRHALVAALGEASSQWPPGLLHFTGPGSLSIAAVVGLARSGVVWGMVASLAGLADGATALLEWRKAPIQQTAPK